MEPTRTFDLIDRYLALFPDADAFAAKSDGKWIKYSAREYNDYSRWFAYGLLELGFRKGDKIATITRMKNLPDRSSMMMDGFTPGMLATGWRGNSLMLLTGKRDIQALERKICCPSAH